VKFETTISYINIIKSLIYIHPGYEKRLPLIQIQAIKDNFLKLFLLVNGKMHLNEFTDFVKVVLESPKFEILWMPSAAVPELPLLGFGCPALNTVKFVG
jgi:hypothetical protein